ncbi:MAG: prephenate dehydrogenase/arogenate dehydrogenase family protein [Anaerolineales bacterium]
MTEAAPEIFLIGLGEIGASIGLALRESGAAAQRIGYDPDGRLVREAVQTGAIDRPASFPGAARGADLIVLSLPAPAVPDALDALAPLLKPDAVVLDTALPRTAAAERVRAGWPAGRHYLGAVPSLTVSALAGPPSGPRPDLFHGGQLGLVLPPGTPEPVARLAFQFAHILGCSPFFVDSSELDGVEASAEALARVAAAALMRAATQAPNWRETERLAGRGLGVAAGLLTWQDPRDLAASLSLNRANVLAKLDALLEALADLRRKIDASDERGLAERLRAARTAYEQWLNQRARGDWEIKETVAPPEEGTGNILQRLFMPRAAGRGRDR